MLQLCWVKSLHSISEAVFIQVLLSFSLNQYIQTKQRLKKSQQQQKNNNIKNPKMFNKEKSWILFLHAAVEPESFKPLCKCPAK